MPACAPAAGSAPTAAPGQPVNLNTATLEQLDALSGVGPVTAQKIIDYREEHGGFRAVDELGEVPGIGDVRLAALREQVKGRGRRLPGGGHCGRSYAKVSRPRVFRTEPADADAMESRFTLAVAASS